MSLETFRVDVRWPSPVRHHGVIAPFSQRRESIMSQRARVTFGDHVPEDVERVGQTRHQRLQMPIPVFSHEDAQFSLRGHIASAASVAQIGKTTSTTKVASSMV